MGVLSLVFHTFLTFVFTQYFPFSSAHHCTDFFNSTLRSFYHLIFAGCSLLDYYPLSTANFTTTSLFLISLQQMTKQNDKESSKDMSGYKPSNFDSSFRAGKGWGDLEVTALHPTTYPPTRPFLFVLYNRRSCMIIFQPGRGWPGLRPNATAVKMQSNF
jgi:hypothetical protein